MSYVIAAPEKLSAATADIADIGSNGQNNVVSYVANTPITTWNNFDVLGFVDNAETIEPVTNSWYLTSIQAGFEPWGGSVGASVDSFSASVNGVD